MISVSGGTDLISLFMTLLYFVSYKNINSNLYWQDSHLQDFQEISLLTYEALYNKYTKSV